MQGCSPGSSASFGAPSALREPGTPDGALVNALLFLAIAAVLATVGVTVLWSFNRKPTSIDSSIRAVQKEMHALSPEARARAAHDRHEQTGGR